MINHFSGFFYSIVIYYSVVYSFRYSIDIVGPVYYIVTVLFISIIIIDKTCHTFPIMLINN